MERLLVLSRFPSEDDDAPVRVIAEIPACLEPYSIVNVCDAFALPYDEASDQYPAAVLAWELGNDTQVTQDAELDSFRAALEDTSDLVAVLS